jgi:hypothetical protein
MAAVFDDRRAIAVLVEALVVHYPLEPVEHDPFGPLLAQVDKTPTVDDGEQPWNPDGPLYYDGPDAT